MLHLYRAVAFLFFVTAVTPAAYAVGFSEAFERLKDSGKEYRQQGTICEQVARLELEEIYPNSLYVTQTGIAYADEHRIIGELDVVVFQRTTGRAVLIGEVKCWKNLRKAHNKASKQRARFIRTMNSETEIEFFSVSRPDRRYEQAQFSTPADFIAISQRGGENAGFEMNLELSLDDLMRLRGELMQCQAQGTCKKPN